jgi:hypothetical protein
MFKSLKYQKYELPQNLSHLTTKCENPIILISELYSLKAYLQNLDKKIEVNFQPKILTEKKIEHPRDKRQILEGVEHIRRGT